MTIKVGDMVRIVTDDNGSENSIGDVGVVTEIDAGETRVKVDGGPSREVFVGMTMRDYFAGQALANGEICTGQAAEYYLKAWFGDRGGITREEIAVRQAYNHADIMLSARKEASNE